jgi:hypothetical protein
MLGLQVRTLDHRSSWWRCDALRCYPLGGAVMELGYPSVMFQCLRWKVRFSLFLVYLWPALLEDPLTSVSVQLFGFIYKAGIISWNWSWMNFIQMKICFVLQYTWPYIHIHPLNSKNKSTLFYGKSYSRKCISLSFVASVKYWSAYMCSLWSNQKVELYRLAYVHIWLQLRIQKLQPWQSWLQLRKLWECIKVCT